MNDDLRKACVERCRSTGKVEGVCAAICMQQLGDAPGRIGGCEYAVTVHGEYVMNKRKPPVSGGRPRRF